MRSRALIAVLASALCVLPSSAALRTDRSACGAVGDGERTVSAAGHVAFVRCTADGSAWLYVEEAGRERRLVPATYGCCYRPSDAVVFRGPAWSPDGRRIAVVVEDVGGTDVWTIDVASRSARRITAGPGRERGPRWSRDGRAIAFRTETDRVESVPVVGPWTSRQTTRSSSMTRRPIPVPG